MARARSPEKRSAILLAAVHEIAETGLGAATSKIAKRAGVAEGTLFTYFSTKEELFNELYLDLKVDVFRRINRDFPTAGSLERRAEHIWANYLAWALEFPQKRKVSVLLHLCNILLPETRAHAATGREHIDAAMDELDKRCMKRGLPAGFAAATMTAMQDATIDLITRQPKARNQIVKSTFQAVWRALK